MVDFRGRTAGWVGRFRNSLLRADRDPGAGAAGERPAPLRRDRALSAGGGAEGAGGWIYFGRDPAVVLRLLTVHSGLATLEENRTTEDGGVGCQARTDPKHAEAFEEA